jgi:hypothetical protein
MFGAHGRRCGMFVIAAKSIEWEDRTMSHANALLEPSPFLDPCVFLDPSSSLLGRKRGLIVIAENVINEEDIVINSQPISSTARVMEERVMTNLQLLVGQEVIPAYPGVPRVAPADVQDALTKGFRDFLPFLDFLADSTARLWSECLRKKNESGVAAYALLKEDSDEHSCS